MAQIKQTRRQLESLIPAEAASLACPSATGPLERPAMSGAERNRAGPPPIGETGPGLVPGEYSGPGGI